MERFRFEHTEMLWLLGLVPVLLALMIWILVRRKKLISRFGDMELFRSASPQSSVSRIILKFILLMLASIFLVVGLANPQMGTKIQTVKKEGAEIVVALDVSNSMLAEDIKPNRLEKAKLAIYQLLDRLKNDKIGIIIFAGRAYTVLPMTDDYANAKQRLSSINTNTVPTQGTAIGRAIDKGIEAFSEDDIKNNAIIVITDGENHEDNAIQMAESASKAGIVVHTIGMGLSKGAPVPVSEKYGGKDYRKDKEGNVVVSKLNEEMLRNIAVAGDGMYIRASNADVGLTKLLDRIRQMDKKEFETKKYTDYENHFQEFLLIGLALLLLEMMILERKNKWLQQVKI